MPKTLKVTNVEVFIGAKIIDPINKIVMNSKVKAIAKVVLNSQLQLTNLKVIEGINGMFIGYPSDTSGKNEYSDVYYPLNPDLRTAIENAIIGEYERLLTESNKSVKLPYKVLTQTFIEYMLNENDKLIYQGDRLKKLLLEKGEFTIKDLVSDVDKIPQSLAINKEDSTEMMGVDDFILWD